MEQRTIRPYHLFTHEKCTYLINVEDMTATIIHETMAKRLQKARGQSIAMLEQGTQEDLKKLGLLSEGKQKTPVSQREQPVVSLSLFLTQSCNLSCVYCYGDGGFYGKEGNMDEKTAFQAVDWLIEQSGKMKQIYIGFFGGEPFLQYPLMKAIVEYAKKRADAAEKRVSFHATSNATLFDDEVIDFIKDQEISVLVSFDGPKEIQDAQRPYINGDRSYDTILPKIKRLLAAVPKTPGHAVLVGDTDPKIVKDALQEIGFTEISLIPASKSLFIENQDEEKQARDTEGLMQELEQESHRWHQGIWKRDTLALKELISKSALYYAITALLHNTRRRHACGAGLGMVAISSVGDVYLCHRFVGQEEYKLGSIFQKNLNKKFQESPTTSHPMCSVCFAKYYCAGGCKHDNAGYCGSITVPAEDLCRVRCRELELAAIIVSNLSLDDRGFLVEKELFPPKPCPLDF